MDTETTQLDQSSTDTKTGSDDSLRGALKDAYAEIAARDDNPETDSQTTDDLDTDQEQSDEIQEPGQELQLEHEQTEEIEHEDGPSGDETLNTEGQNSREGLQVAEELQTTFDYLPKEDREHLIEAGYDEDTVNQYLRLVKDKNDKYIQKTQQYSELVKVLEPYGDALAQQGITPAQKISQYIAWEKGILGNPLEGMIQLGRSLGFDLVKMISDKQSSDQNKFEDPAQKEISELRARLDARDTQDTEQLNQRLVNQVKEFQNAKDGEGNLKYPHFDKIKTYMAPLVEQGKTLEEAYNHIVDELNVGMPSQIETRKTRKSVSKAKKAAFRVKSSKSSSRVKEQPGTLRDDLKAGLKQLNIGR